MRIDEGVKRGPRPKRTHPPKAALTGMFLCSVEPDRKKMIIADAHNGIASGLNTDQIGQRHGIPGRTLRYWLLNDDDADKARKALIDQELARVGEEMKEAKTATSPLPLACAREEFRYWSWMAERRDAKRYGVQQQAININAQGPVSIQVVSYQPAEGASLGASIRDVTEDSK